MTSAAREAVSCEMLPPRQGVRGSLTARRCQNWTPKIMVSARPWTQNHAKRNGAKCLDSAVSLQAPVLHKSLHVRPVDLRCQPYCHMHSWVVEKLSAPFHCSPEVLTMAGPRRISARATSCSKNTIRPCPILGRPRSTPTPLPTT